MPNSKTKVVISQGKLDELHEIIEKRGFNDGIKFMHRRVLAEEQEISVKYELKCFLHEGLLALVQAVEKISGFTDMAATEGESNNEPPTFIDVTLPDGGSIKVPHGRISLPTFHANSYLDTEYDFDSTSIIIEGIIRNKNAKDVDDIIKEAQNILNNKSLYTGRAISIEFDADGDVMEPKFINLDSFESDKVLISEEARHGLIPILSRLNHPVACIREGLDLKYGTLIEGPYGTGKTLLAFYVAKEAIAAGSTFIYLKDCTHIAKTLKIAENYTKNNQPVVIFAEDIDQTVRGNRNSHMQNILNTLDGGDTKNIPIISMFTTNHIQLIEPTFLRGKRIGGLISLGALDKELAIKFIKTFVRNSEGATLMEDKHIALSAEYLVGIVPAFASEVIDKAKAYMINKGANTITASDIKFAADSYKKQMELSKLKIFKEESTLEESLKIIGKELVKGTEITMSGNGAQLKGREYDGVTKCSSE